MDIEHGQNHRATEEDGNEDGHDSDHEEEGAASPPSHTQVLCTHRVPIQYTYRHRTFFQTGRQRDNHGVLGASFPEAVWLSFRNATLKPQASSTFKLSRVQTHKILSTHYTGKADFP